MSTLPLKWAVEITSQQDVNWYEANIASDECQELYATGLSTFSGEPIAFYAEDNRDYVGRIQMFKNKGYTILSITELEKLLNENPMSEDKESQQPNVTVSEYTVEEATVTGKVFIIGDGNTGADMAKKIILSRGINAIGHYDMGQTTLTVQDIEQIKEQLPPPIPIKPTPLFAFDQPFMEKTKPSKHQNKKQYTRKKNGKKTHRKK